MPEIILSRLQYVAAGIVFQSSLFSFDDLAHLNHVEVKIAPTTVGKRALIAYVKLYFDRWTYVQHGPSDHPAHKMPAEVSVVFLQNRQRKLTGYYTVAFFYNGDPGEPKFLHSIVGW